ncbi:MAG: hypothetical protein E7157_03075 [Lactobacillales bacterium]|nr:hypothetical protein [Lactobacillales bacterium]
MKRINGKSYLIIGLILIIIGIFTLIGSVDLFKSVANLVFIFMVLISIKDLFSFILKKPNKDIKLFIKIFNVIISILALIFNEYSIAIVPIIFSAYSLLNAFINSLNFILLKINKIKGGYKLLFFGLFYLLIGVIILLGPIVHLDFVLLVLGIYSILLGFSFVFDYLEINHFRRFFKIRICLPSILEVFIPLSVLQKVNRKINNDEEIVLEEKKENINPDLEIFVHVTQNGFGTLGHMDIYFNGEFISYGNYDISSYKLYDGIGRGILFIIKDKQKYIDFCIEDNKKTLFSFGIKLNEKEKKQIEKNINKVKENLKEWYPPYVQAKNKNKKAKIKDYMDYSSRLYRTTSADFYKFKTGKFKSFSVLGNNCVSFANKIIGSVLKDKFKFYGVLTPGTYYDYLEREFMKKGSIVVSKKIYTKSSKN